MEMSVQGVVPLGKGPSGKVRLGTVRWGDVLGELSFSEMPV